MDQKDCRFVRANEIAADLGVSMNCAYKLIREMNAELKEKGYITIAGRVSRKYYEERLYSITSKK